MSEVGSRMFSVKTKSPPTLLTPKSPEMSERLVQWVMCRFTPMVVSADRPSRSDRLLP